MISLTRKTDYALLALTSLAGAKPGNVVSAREIAGQYGVSLSLLMNVLKQLAGCGMVTSVRGARGGYVLARPADQITLAELIDAIEGPVRLAPCVSGSTVRGAYDICQSGGSCPIHRPLSRLQHRLEGFFAGITLVELVAGEAGAAARAGEAADEEEHASGR
jgi:Rrf2 family protein